MSTTTSARVTRWLTAAPLVLFVYLTTALLIAERAAATDYTGCPGTLTGVVLGSSTFSLDAGCALTIDGGSATDLNFTTAHTDLVLIVKNLDCGTGINTRGSCVNFAATLTGGSISIDGITRTIGPGAVGTGMYNVVRFSGAVSGTDISIVGVQLTLSSVTCTGSLVLYAVYAAGNVTGKNAAGSIVNVSNMRVTGSATSSGGGIAVVSVITSSALTMFETVESSGNDFSGLTLSGSTIQVVFVYFMHAVTLIGTAASSIVMRGNSVRGMVVTGSSEWARVFLWHGPFTGTPLVSGVSTVVIDGFDARDCTITAVTYAQLHGIYFASNNGISMNDAGSITINNVWLGGQMSYGETDSTSYGAKVAFFQTLTGVKVITVTNSLIDMGTSRGLAASGTSVSAIAAIMHFASAVAVATSMTATNTTIRGKFSSASGQVQLHVLLSSRTFSVPTLTIDGGSGVTSTTAPVIHQGPVRALPTASATPTSASRGLRVATSTSPTASASTSHPRSPAAASPSTALRVRSSVPW
jgi:hypothetical protein